MICTVQSLSDVRLFATPWTAACQASLSTNSRSLLKLMCIKLVMPSNHLIFCRPLFLLPSIFPSIRVFANETRRLITSIGTCSVQFSCSVTSNSLWPHGLQHTRPPCLSPTPGVYSNSCPLSWWCHPTISSSVVPFSCCLQSFPASASFPMSQFFASDSLEKILMLGKILFCFHIPKNPSKKTIAI